MQKNEELSEEEQHKLKCLINHLLTKKLGKRQTMLSNMEEIHGREAIDHIKMLLTAECEKRKHAKLQAKIQLKEMLEKNNASEN